jgi:hypothetical protein
LIGRASSRHLANAIAWCVRALLLIFREHTLKTRVVASLVINITDNIPSTGSH